MTKMLMKISRAYAILPIFLLIVGVLVGISQPPPVWMKKGSYAEYKFETRSVVFLNNTLLLFRDRASVIYRWECIEFNGTIAKLNVSITFSEKEKHVFLSTEVYVNTVNRDVFLTNGTLVGKTRLWGPVAPEKGETIVLWYNPPDRVIGNVIDIEGGWSWTPHGAQRIFIVEGNGTIRGQTISLTILYDFDTGIMIEGSLYYEATLLALSIIDPGRAGPMQLINTNIDLGPKEIWPEILNILLITMPIIAFLMIFALVHHCRRKRRKIVQRKIF